MGIVVKLRDALGGLVGTISEGETQCTCTDKYVCRICQAKAVLEEVNKIIASGGEGIRPRRQVECITTGRVFDTLKDASEAYGVVSATISKACKGQLKFAGKLGNQKLEWRYYDGNKTE